MKNRIESFKNKQLSEVDKRLIRGVYRRKIRDCKSTKQRSKGLFVEPNLLEKIFNRAMNKVEESSDDSSKDLSVPKLLRKQTLSKAVLAQLERNWSESSQINPINKIRLKNILSNGSF